MLTSVKFKVKILYLPMFSTLWCGLCIGIQLSKGNLKAAAKQDHNKSCLWLSLKNMCASFSCPKVHIIFVNLEVINHWRKVLNSFYLTYEEGILQSNSRIKIVHPLSVLDIMFHSAVFCVPISFFKVMSLSPWLGTEQWLFEEYFKDEECLYCDRRVRISVQ